MKTCVHCKIQVGGGKELCPLCQSPLNADVNDENEDSYWPEAKKLKKQPMPVKILLFITFSALVICFAADFLFAEDTHRHWSVPVMVSTLIILVMVRHFVRIHKSVPKILFQSMLALSALSMYIGWYLGFYRISIDFVVPALCCVTLVLNFIFSLIDVGFASNSLVYILCNIILGVFPYVVFWLYQGKVPKAWTATWVLSIITLIGLAVFKGKAVVTEMQKRLHM